jgi:hypothetical protein
MKKLSPMPKHSLFWGFNSILGDRQGYFIGGPSREAVHFPCLVFLCTPPASRC